MVCFRVLSVHANMFSCMSKLAQFVNILAQFVFARSYFGNKMAHFVSARIYDNKLLAFISDYFLDEVRAISVTESEK